MKAIICIVILLSASCVFAALGVAVGSPKVSGRKVLVPLAMKNNFAEKVESARAVCFLIDEQGKVVGQATRWVIGGSQDKSPIAPGATKAFNFVVVTDKPFAATNVTAKVSFSRLVLEGGKPADAARQVTVTPAAK